MIGTTITGQTIRGIIQGRMEASEPADTILQVLERFDGKRVDVRLDRALREATDDPNLRIVRLYGMTQIVSGDYARTNGQAGVCVLLSYQTTNARVDSSWVYDKNPAYYAARDARNKQRLAALYSEDAPERLAAAAMAYLAARASLRELLDEAMFEPDRYAIQKELGLDD